MKGEVRFGRKNDFEALHEAAFFARPRLEKSKMGSLFNSVLTVDSTGGHLGLTEFRVPQVERKTIWEGNSVGEIELSWGWDKVGRRWVAKCPLQAVKGLAGLRLTNFQVKHPLSHLPRSDKLPTTIEIQ